MKQRILIIGGGTSAGPTVPLIAIYESLKEMGDFEFRWIGTKHGPEQKLIALYNIPFYTFPAAKLRRYFSFRTLIEPFVFVFAFIKALFFLIQWRPGVMVSVGAYVSVPVVIAGWVLRIPAIIHQQDIRPTLSNKLMSPFVNRITVTFDQQVKDFPKKKVVVTGNPVRKEVLHATDNGTFNLESGVPALLVVGGGQGSSVLNQLVKENLSSLTEMCQIIHITGKQESVDRIENPRYHQFEFLTDTLPEAIKVSDIIVSRAGMSFLTEFAVLGKPAVVIPIAGSHQELNANYFENHSAAKVLHIESKVSAKEQTIFNSTIKALLLNTHEQDDLSNNIKELIPVNAAQRISQEIITLLPK